MAQTICPTCKGLAMIDPYATACTTRTVGLRWCIVCPSPAIRALDALKGTK